ncbi:carboxylesterase/lipase family protein [Mucilaginibacter sp. X5P1]|uniref:carboxylesterase/lipase family protein n=1 Tax=Mucilaginibacter sp. X5P1 TaxID=2723088 RepID=UPI001618300B|nr:carboxylesterase family protein [Mucilaginibacter sp. X5P1]MBB6138956.1 para-nitrobenzyl esterase [Mucilaginibacter sp. X5P1]
MLSRIRYIILFLAICIACKASAQNNDPVVKTDKGYIRGIVENNVQVFKGIPYGAPPVGDLRFMPPAAHATWTDTLAATKFGPIATQYSGNKVIGSEDCLSLNLYTPKTDNHKRAVVVWIHGGSMTNGSGKGMNGHAFADHDDIVTITINYRLGAFGFLYMGDVDKRYAQSGNCGVLDVIAALKWIKQNITSFGGDPNRITIMGESAGAKLISAVMVSPQSRGLFQQCILESGSVQCIRDTVTAKNERLRLLNKMGLISNDVRNLLTLPADSIMKIQGIITEGIGGNSCFGPVYDGKVILMDGYKYAAGKEQPPIKALIGTNEYEAAAFVGPNSDLKDANNTIFKPLFEDDAPIVYAAYQQQLKTDSPYAAEVKILTQYMYQMHSYRFARVLAQNNIPVWMYRFKYDNGKSFGAKHGEELQYIWNTNTPNTITDSVKKQLTINLHGAWIAFIKTGNPNISSLPQWPKYNSNTRQVMMFDTTDSVTGLKDVYDDKSFPSQVFMLK